MAFQCRGNYLRHIIILFITGHSGSRGVQRNEGAVHEEGGRVSTRFLRHRPPQLPEHTELPHTDPEGQGQRYLPNDTGRQQSGPRPAAQGHRGRWPHPGHKVKYSVYRDECQGSSNQCGSCIS